MATIHDVSPDIGYGPATTTDDYERRALAGAFYDAAAAVHLSAHLQPEDFEVTRYRELFRAILAQRELDGYQDQPVDASQILGRTMTPEGSTDEGMLQTLLEVMESKPYGVFHEFYAGKVLEASRIRKIRSIGDMLKTEDAASNVLLESAREKLEAVTEGAVEDTRSAAELTGLVSAVLIEHADTGGGSMGVATGFRDLDRITDGWPISGMTVIGARPSVGKTALALVLARNIAKRNSGVLFFSLEMSRMQLVERLISIEAHRNPRAMREKAERGFITQAIIEGSEQVEKLTSLYIDDTPGLTVQQIVSRVMVMHRKTPLTAVFIDYLHLVGSGEKTESQTHETTRVSAGLKFGARATGLPFLVLAQLNRSTEAKRERPTMATLRQSGAIEQDADMILLLHREDYQNERECPEDRKGILEVNVAKNRNGPTGQVDLRYDRETGCIAEVTEEEPPPPPHRNPPNYHDRED